VVEIAELLPVLAPQLGHVSAHWSSGARALQRAFDGLTIEVVAHVATAERYGHLDDPTLVVAYEGADQYQYRGRVRRTPSRYELVATKSARGLDDRNAQSLRPNESVA
jgi:hypothetical protein